MFSFEPGEEILVESKLLHFLNVLIDITLGDINGDNFYLPFLLLSYVS